MVLVAGSGGVNTASIHVLYCWPILMSAVAFAGGNVALVDGDVLTYLAGFACQKTIWTHKPSGEWFTGKKAANEWWALQSPDKMDEDEWSSEIEVEPWDHCAFIIDGKIAECIHMTKSDSAIVFLTPSKTFRHDLAFTRGYKANRIGAPKPVYYDKIREYFVESYGAITGVNVEADDLMGMAQTANSVICSNDKDMLQIAGKHYNFTKPEEEAFTLVDPYSGDRWFFCQLLSGDTTDNIPGIPKVGKKKAEDMVSAFDDDKELVAAIKEQYVYSYGAAGLDVMEEQAALVWILRSGETPEQAGWRELLGVTYEETKSISA